MAISNGLNFFDKTMINIKGSGIRIVSASLGGSEVKFSKNPMSDNIASNAAQHKTTISVMLKIMFCFFLSNPVLANAFFNPNKIKVRQTADKVAINIPGINVFFISEIYAISCCVFHLETIT
jgi:hypothetical protein